MEATAGRIIDKVAYKKTNALGIVDWEIREVVSFKELSPAQKIEYIKNSLVEFIDIKGEKIPLTEALKLLKTQQ
jgi:hypothetical protein